MEWCSKTAQQGACFCWPAHQRWPQLVQGSQDPGPRVSGHGSHTIKLLTPATRTLPSPPLHTRRGTCNLDRGTAFRCGDPRPATRFSRRHLGRSAKNAGSTNGRALKVGVSGSQPCTHNLGALLASGGATPATSCSSPNTGNPHSHTTTHFIGPPPAMASRFPMRIVPSRARLLR